MLQRLLPSGLSGQGALGDLAEGYGRRAGRSRLRAGLWYAGQVASVAFHRGVDGLRDGVPGGDSDLAADIRWSLRTLTRHPGFAVGVVGILGLGLGANAAVFAVVDGTLRGAGWWKEGDATVAIWPEREFGFGQLDLYRQEQSVYRVLGGYTELAWALRAPDGRSQSVNGVRITPALFRELAVQPVRGRPLADDDALLGTEPVVVMGEGLWRRSFGADPDLVGSTVDIGGASVRVVGIQGAGGTAPGGRTELWFPLVMDPRDDDFWRLQNLTVVGVLEDGATLEDARRSLTEFTDRLSELFPMFYEPGFAEGLANVQWADEAQRRRVSTPLLLLLGGTALLLLVTALNVGNLLLGRSLDRRRELAIRAALGAGRSRIVRQLLVEGTVLAALALAVGLTASSFGARWIAGLFMGEAVVAHSGGWSPAVLAFTAGAAVLAALVLNGVPVAHFLRVSRSGPNVAPDPGAGTRRALVGVQAALATLLLVSAALLAATVENLRDVPLGFEPDGLVALELSPPEDRVGSLPAARELYDRLVAGAEAVPGVEAAGLTGWLPLAAQAPPTPINVRDAPVPQARAVKAPLHLVDPGFFEAFGIRPLEGRLLGSEDRRPAAGAVVVNGSLARTLFPDGPAVGRMIAIDPHAWERWMPVVGVIPDVRSGEITGGTEPALYVALAESPARKVSLVVRASGGTHADLAGLMPALRRAVTEADPLVPVRSVATMEDVVRAAYATAWVMMGLLGALAALATTIGATGIYAVLTRHVAAARSEMGVRMALGARPGTLVLSVVRSGLVVTGAGIVAGCAAAALSARFLEALLFEVSALTPWAYLGPAATLALVAVLAAWIPAVRAGRLAPSEALRAE